MKTLRNIEGEIRYKTLTVRELIQKLSKFHPDMPVLTTWEGIYVSIGPGDICIEKIEYIHPADDQECLTIDAEGLSRCQ